MEARQHLFNSDSEAWRIASSLSFCLAKIVGKFEAYPRIDAAAFRRIHIAIGDGLEGREPETPIEDFCQELRGVITCPIEELLRPRGADDTDIRITAIAQVVREHAGLKDDIFRELVRGLLSWEPDDKQVILEALANIIRG